MTTLPTEAWDIGEVADWRSAVLTRVRGGARFAGLYGSGSRDGTELIVLLAVPDGVERVSTLLHPDEYGRLRYPALSPDLPAAFWYERALHDLSGVMPVDHPRLDPLLLPLPEGLSRPRPGHHPPGEALHPEERAATVDVTGHGMFTIPFGPVRSGVFESIEFLVETPGEEIPHLTIRPHYKHRGIAKRFEGHGIDDGVLVAERVEGIASVAHALAFSHAVETLALAEVPARAGLLRVVYAELERIANHLDVAMRLADAAGLAVAVARFGWHKECVQRLVSRMCGSRFGRGVITPGGVHAVPAIPIGVATHELAAIHARIRSDRNALMETATFLDRLRGTGQLAADLARAHGALGPVGRGSGFDDDDRVHRAYDGYPQLRPMPTVALDEADAMARLRVRWAELDAAVALIDEAAIHLQGMPEGRLNVPIHARDGFAAGWAEAPQGEVLYGLEMSDGRIRRCFARSASFHNLVLFHEVFHGDVLTDFPFIEASFGLSYAGVAM